MNLSKQLIVGALQELSDELGKQNVMGEVCLFGGTVMVLAYAARLATKDVDAIFSPSPIIRTLAKNIGEARHLPEGWLNDGVKGFVSSRHEVIEGNLPQFPNLRLTMPTPAYLLAMKCLASRIDYSTAMGGDVADIVFLIRHLKLKSASEVLAIVSDFYPPTQIPLKSQYLIEGLFAEGKI